MDVCLFVAFMATRDRVSFFPEEYRASTRRIANRLGLVDRLDPGTGAPFYYEITDKGRALNELE
jgi:hypothetical protein